MERAKMTDPEKLTASWVESWEKLLAQNLPFRIFLKGRDLTYLACNQNFAANLGIKPGEILGRTDYDLYPRELAERYRAEDLRILENGQSETFEGHYVKDGQEHYGQTIKTPFRDPSGEVVIGILGTFWEVTELVQVKEALRESEHLLIEAQRIGKIGSWEWDPAENKVVWSAEMYEIFGIAPGTALTTEVGIQAFHPEDRAMVAEATRKTLAELKPQLIECRVLKPDGSIGYVQGRGEIVLDANGQILKMIGIYQDITERRQAEEALRQSEERFRATINASPDGFAVMDLAGKLEMVSPALLAMRGCEREEEMVGHSNLEFFPPEDWDHVKSYVALIQQGETTGPSELRAIRVDGSLIDIETNGVLVRGANGQPTGMSFVVRNITERKRAEEALRETKERLEMALVGGGLGTYELNLQTGETQVDARYLAMLGYAPGELDLTNMKHWEELVHPDDLAQTRSPHTEVEYRMRHKDGHWIWVLDAGRVVEHDSLGRPLRMSGVHQDITERKRSEEALRESDIRFKKLSDHVPGMIYQFLKKPDGSYCVPFTTEAIQEIFGCSPQDVRDDFSPIAKAILPEDLESVIDSIDYSAQHQTPWQCEYRAQLPGQPVRWMLGQATPERLADGSVIWYGFNTDITERKRAEEALRENESSLQTILQSTADGLLAVDRENRVLLTNERFGELWKIPQELIDSKDDTTLLQYVLDQLANPQDFLQKVQQLYRSDEDSFDILYFKDGRMFERLSRPLKVGTELRGRVWSFRDITDRKRAEEALRQSEEKYRSVFNNFIDLYYQTDMQGLITNLSPSCYLLSGWQPEELIGHQVLEFYPDPEQRKALLEKLLLEGAVSDYEITLLHRDGRFMSVSVSSHLIRDEQGNPKYVEGTIRDVGERKRAEEALQESLQKYQFLADHMNDIVWTLDMDLRTSYVSPSVESVLGFTLEERMKQDIQLQLTPASLFLASDTLAKEIVNDQTGQSDSNRSVTLELEYFHKDGSTRWLENVMTGIRNEQGVLSGFHGVSRDISERRRTEEALRESEEKHRAVVERANEGIVILQDGIIRFTNPGLLAMTGYRTEDVEGMELSRFIPEENQALVLERYHKRMAGEELSGLFETVMLHKSGKKIPIEMNGGIIQYDGKPADLVIIRDITGRKQIEGEMEKTRANFLFGVSHELKTPLFLMDISLEMLENSPESGRVKRTAEFMDTWKRNLHRLQHLVFNMVDSQRTQTMGFKLERQPADFVALVERVVAEQGLFAGPKKVRITVDLAPIPPLWIDPEAIHRLVENLLTNAIKFSPRNGEVSLRLTQEDGQIVFSVKDQGPGIPTEEQKDLFLPFQRAATAVRSVIPGTGLGLYVAKIIVDAHGGMISLRSKVGKGTTVTVRLPLGEPQD
jgi:PAS domain S-box-containing protein